MSLLWVITITKSLCVDWFGVGEASESNLTEVFIFRCHGVKTCSAKKKKKRKTSANAFVDRLNNTIWHLLCRGQSKMSLDILHVAADILESIQNGQGTIKNLCYNTTKNVNKKALYAMVCECGRHFHALEKCVQSCGNLKALDAKPAFWMLMLFEFINGRFRYDLNDKYVQLFWKHKEDLKKDYLAALKNFPPHQDSADDNKPKYMRINRLIDADELPEEFEAVKSEKEMLKNPKTYMFDKHIKDLLVLSPKCNITELPGYKNGALVSQDKASCLPAYILSPPKGAHVIDCCAAPGNKTTQLASYVGVDGKVFAIERDSERFEILKKMVSRAGASSIVECHNRDFLALDPSLPKYSHVEYALVDPSCSGSGMPHSLERYIEGDKKKDSDDSRLEQLARFQTMAIKQAMRFPKVKSVVYSTCSVNERENEAVVQEVLESMPDWTLAKRPLPDWPRRGLPSYPFHQNVIRSDPNKDKMIGFFVALFVRK